MSPAIDCTASEVEGKETQADVLAGFFEGMMQLAADANRRLTGKRLTRGGSKCLAMAVEAGLSPAMAYTVADTLRYTGLSRNDLYAEIRAGRLRVVVPAGNKHGMRITVAEMDRWMEENTR